MPANLTIETRVAGSRDSTAQENCAGDFEIGGGGPIPIPAGSVDRHVPVGWTAANLIVLFLKATVNMLLKTNDPKRPGDTFELKAGVPYVYRRGGYHPLLIEGDVTGLFVTPAGEEPGDLDVHGLMGPPEKPPAKPPAKKPQAKGDGVTG